MSKAKSLPDFDNPPVVEVVAGVQFSPLNLPSAWFGRWWEQIAKRYPHTEDKPRLDDRIEGFGAPHPPRVQLQVANRPPTPRVWFMDKPNGTELLQVQEDKLIFNWRGHEGGVPYPRYAFVQKKFSTIYEEFERFARKNVRKRLEPNQCELTYINYIAKGDGWDSLQDVREIFKYFSINYDDSKYRELESFNFRISNRLLDRNREPTARMYITCELRYQTSSGAPLIYLELTVRGAPKSKTKRSVISFLNEARNHIVLNFANITTEKMHKRWGRKDV